MSDRLECAACHHEGYDVTARIVRIPDPQATTRITSVTGEHRVPARYISQMRCIDGVSCQERQDDREPLTFDAEGTVL